MKARRSSPAWSLSGKNQPSECDMGAANEKTEWSKGQSGDRMGDIVGFDPHCGWLRNPASPKGWLKHVETLYINSGIHYNDNIYISYIVMHTCWKWVWETVFWTERNKLRINFWLRFRCLLFLHVSTRLSSRWSRPPEFPSFQSRSESRPIPDMDFRYQQDHDFCYGRALSSYD